MKARFLSVIFVLFLAYGIVSSECKFNLKRFFIKAALLLMRITYYYF